MFILLELLGPLNIAIHPTWAPVGAENFLNMVKTGFFSSNVGLFRAIKNFIVQFGLAGSPAVQRKFEMEFLQDNLKDDAQWLGKAGVILDIRSEWIYENSCSLLDRNGLGVPRFQQGYISYAGAGPDTRRTQLFFTFEDSAHLGAAAWEVPFGQLVGEESFETLSKINTEYGEDPSQEKINYQGNKYLEKEFPNLDYIESCEITAEDLPWKFQESAIKLPDNWF